MSPLVIGLASLYGAASILMAAWATVLILRLMGRVLAPRQEMLSASAPHHQRATAAQLRPLTSNR